MAIVKSADFQLLQGETGLTDYQHVPDGKSEPFLHLQFCSRCGVRPFSKGGFLPPLGSDFYAVNLACLDDVTETELAQAPVNFVDGRSNTFAPIKGETRHL